MSILEQLAEYKIFSRVTASTVVIGGMIMMYKFMTSGSVNPEVIAVVAGIVGSAGTFLFMSEKS